MITILIVEDEQNISELIRLNLTDAGYHCSCAYDGAAAAGLIESGYSCEGIYQITVGSR